MTAQLKLFEPKRNISTLKTWLELSVHEKINVNANCFIHGVYRKGNGRLHTIRYRDYPYDRLTKRYFMQYHLNAGSFNRLDRYMKAKEGKLFN